MGRCVWISWVVGAIHDAVPGRRRYHAQRSLTLIDSSTNGVYVNGRRVTKGAAQTLQLGDDVCLGAPPSVGEGVFRFVVEGLGGAVGSHHLVLHHAQISRRHCSLTFHPVSGTFTVRSDQAQAKRRCRTLV